MFVLTSLECCRPKRVLHLLPCSERDFVEEKFKNEQSVKMTRLSSVKFKSVSRKRKKKKKNHFCLKNLFLNFRHCFAKLASITEHGQNLVTNV